MRTVKKFDEYVKNGTVKVQKPDISRSEFLTNEAESSYNFLQEMIEKIKISDSNANDYVKSCYDILMEVIRAKMLLSGYNATGQGAHQAEVSYLRELKFKETDILFADQLRYFRNGILYYGTKLDKEYANKVIEFTKKVYDKISIIH